MEQYLSDRQRISQALLPNKKRKEKLNDEEWRIRMLPIEFLFLTTFPVIYMNIIVKTPGQGYPPGISKNVKKVLTLNAVSIHVDFSVLNREHNCLRLSRI